MSTNRGMYKENGFNIHRRLSSQNECSYVFLQKMDASGINYTKQNVCTTVLSQIWAKFN